ncbi:hypothetical protein N5T98_04205 [Aliarcobacter cryaerophilus]|uniref:hypothetical protein n=1 Tax=Aliarcobacter cryaerophilus TaxID=28198 RepID=UPI0021B6053D|nr:hypothetical protein [Aliarcobacter cryaerophilus]MCT7486231.1 hypothetical protein [Aliarcobacter cryaerophilus]MCT7490294.1 hypothetical protein [Aliarcobacter cryaerophilus]
MSKLLDNISDSLIILSKETKECEVRKNQLREILRDYDSFEKKFNEIPFQKYQAWIPNNAGILNWVRIGTEYEAKQRYLFKKGTFKEFSFENNKHHVIQPIEIMDTDVGIDDSLLKNKSLYPIFLSEIYFKNEKDGKLVDVTSGSGHLVNNGKYIGESVLAFFEKETYLKLKNLNINKKLAKCYSSLNKDEYDEIYKTIELFFENNKPAHTYRVKYEVEAKGKIELDCISIEIRKDTKFEIEHIISKEGYKSISQLMYGQIKKVFHGDSHHNHKDDVILKVYDFSEKDITIPIKQMVEHMKGLEKIEKHRHRMNCKDFIPSYVHEADGILAYIEMYYENYVNKSAYQNEGERYLKSARTVHKSLKAIVDRNSEINDLTVNYKKKGRNILTEFPAYLLVFAFIAFLFQNDKLNLHDNTVLNYLKHIFKFFLEDTTFFVFFIVTWLIILMKNCLSVNLCKWIYLHKDYRPKDKFYAYSMNDKIIHKHRLNIIILIAISILLLISYFTY